MKTIRPSYEEKCPDCKYIGEAEGAMCDKHWDELQHDIAAIHADGGEDWKELIYRLMVDPEDSPRGETAGG